ncbi:GUN4 domain-containing protein [Leptothoe sp. PORK10 BA2]|uniref:GUN4 domain-containing protein n=1 Tax=Leptothoe sp. PORK10 BA2 TaxID=3110254 RepID=UPI002B2017FC|nr:GUN4 domain-containing protein [Leptothoe sp. PORK10 BA2]MEA5464271.1 GUN4 domain-containing protein [Leptothoe sp. PORK10 BA2]
MSKMLTLKPLSCVLTVALVTTTMPPTNAQTEPYRVACETTAFLSQGGSLTYRLAGSLPESEEISQNPIRTTLALTVRWQDQTDRVQTLLNASALSDYEQLAPDADYSQVPFEEVFRGQPNNADFLYGTPVSVHGLYVSLRPTSGRPQEIQTVHYLSPDEYVRSAVGNCQTANADDLDSAIDEQLTLLQDRLQAEDWAAADRVTRLLISPGTTRLPPYDPLAFDPVFFHPELIHAIDQMWLTASNGRFGFSVQLRLWQQALADHPNNRDAAVNAFRDRIGWKLAAPRAEVDFISSDWLNESELTYSLQAPAGHLPWAGASDAFVQSVANPPPEIHCGVCTVDAIRLRDGYFYLYIPQLMGRVSLYLDLPVSGASESFQ